MAATQNCHYCAEREAGLLVSLTATGESVYVCLPCSPFWLADLWVVSGLPRFTPTFPDDDDDDGAEPDDLDGELDQSPDLGPGLLAEVDDDDGPIPLAGKTKRSPRTSAGLAASETPESETEPSATHVGS
jgi:hypothetical protein